MITTERSLVRREGCRSLKEAQRAARILLRPPPLLIRAGGS